MVQEGELYVLVNPLIPVLTKTPCYINSEEENSLPNPFSGYLSENTPISKENLNLQGTPNVLSEPLFDGYISEKDYTPKRKVLVEQSPNCSSATPNLVCEPSPKRSPKRRKVLGEQRPKRSPKRSKVFSNQNCTISNNSTNPYVCLPVSNEEASAIIDELLKEISDNSDSESDVCFYSYPRIENLYLTEEERERYLKYYLGKQVKERAEIRKASKDKRRAKRLCP
jgi:hypothetical protein